MEKIGKMVGRVDLTSNGRENDRQMKRIEGYLDNVFSSYAQNEKTIELKKRMNDMLHEKYNYLMERGKNEDEAMGILVNEFGSMKMIERIMEEMGDREPEKMTWKEASECIKKYKKGGTILAFGVCFIIFAYIVLYIIDFAAITTNEATRGTVLVVMNAIGIAIIAFGGIYIKTGKDAIKSKEILEFETYDNVTKKYELFKKKYYRDYFLSILLFALCPIAFCIFENDDLKGILLLVIIYVALFIFINTGNENSVYKSILKKNKR